MTVEELYLWAKEKHVEKLPVYRTIKRWGGGQPRYIGCYQISPLLATVEKQYIRFDDLTKDGKEAVRVLV